MLPDMFVENPVLVGYRPVDVLYNVTPTPIQSALDGGVALLNAVKASVPDWKDEALATYVPFP
jgi:hypothetical protein